MKKSILKYTLKSTSEQIVKLPKGANILTIQTQIDDAQLWALVDCENETEDRVIEIFGTGWQIPDDIGIERIYISTFQMEEGRLIFHAFERIN